MKGIPKLLPVLANARIITVSYDGMKENRRITHNSYNIATFQRASTL